LSNRFWRAIWLYWFTGTGTKQQQISNLFLQLPIRKWDCSWDYKWENSSFNLYL
jgi:hypothetical protein